MSIETSPLTESMVLGAIAQVADPMGGADFVSTKAVRDLRIEGKHVRFGLNLGYPAKTWHASLRRALVAAVESVGAASVDVDIQTAVVAHAVQRGVALVPGVKNIIAVASAKGGVGKSTTTANLALALAAEGARVGVLDADIYGPSLPTLMGIHDKPDSEDGKTMQPVVAHGLQLMSIGFLVDADNPMIWRGPMATQALEQMLRQTAWDDLDYLLVDMPPGTGDIQLTLSQRVPISGAIIVTTPQDIALVDARRGVRMFEKVSVPLLGVMENMAVHICSQCGHAEHVFGEGGGQRMCDDFGLAYLGALPLQMAIRVHADGGRPTMVAAPDSDTAALYRQVAVKAAARMATQARDWSAKFPTITVSSNT